jgi:hypothetical protein
MDSEAFRDYKECQEVLTVIVERVDCDAVVKSRITEQLARFDWDALNAEIKSRAEFV